GISKQRQAKVHAEKRGLVTASAQFAQEQAVAASQIKYRFVRLNRFEDLLHAGLEPLARGRERIAEAVVKLAVDLQKCLRGGRFHRNRSGFVHYNLRHGFSGKTQALEKDQRV